WWCSSRSSRPMLCHASRRASLSPHPLVRCRRLPQYHPHNRRGDMRAATLAIGLAIFVSGCSAKPVVTETPGSLSIDNIAVGASGNTMKGVPVRIKTEQIIHVFRYDPEKDAYIEVSTPHQVIADQSRLYAINVVSGPFSSPSLKIT